MTRELQLRAQASVEGLTIAEGVIYVHIHTLITSQSLAVKIVLILLQILSVMLRVQLVIVCGAVARSRRCVAAIFEGIFKIGPIRVVETIGIDHRAVGLRGITVCLRRRRMASELNRGSRTRTRRSLFPALIPCVRTQETSRFTGQLGRSCYKR